MKDDKSAAEKENKTTRPLTGYKEVRIGRTIYRVTSVYLGEIDLKETLEDLTIRNMLEEIENRDTVAFAVT